MNRAQYTSMYNRLAQSKTRYAECIRLERPDGTVFRFTAHDQPLWLFESDGGRYEYKAADSFELTALETNIGLVVSNMDVKGIISDESITEEDLRAGFFDNAKVELFIAYWSNTNVRTLPLRLSWIGELQVKGSAFRADLRGIAQRLAQIFIQQTSIECRWTFCDRAPGGAQAVDSKCGLDAADFSHFDVEVTSVTDRDQFHTDISAGDYGKFAYGTAVWTEGNNVGQEMEITYNFDNKIHLFLPLPFEIEVGDKLTLIEGCDKRFTTCIGFSNSRRFGGEPFLAGSDILTRYPQSATTEGSSDGDDFDD